MTVRSAWCCLANADTSLDAGKQSVCTAFIAFVFRAELRQQCFFLHTNSCTVTNQAAEKDNADSDNIPECQRNAQQTQNASRVCWMANRMIQSGSDQMLSRCRLHMKRKCFFQSQHSAEPNRDSRRSKRSSNIRNKWWEHHLPQQRRCRLADRADADKQTKGKVAIQQPFCAVVALCGLRARIALSCVKENEQLRKQQTGKDNITPLNTGS